MLDTGTEFVHFVREDGIAVVTIERPPVNAINNQVRDELARVFAEMEEDPEVRCVVLTGGPRIFSAGVDIRGLQAAAASDAVSIISRKLLASALPY
jgi:enoyl-CoA hydratase